MATPEKVGRFCYHCGDELIDCFVAGNWYASNPYDCPACGRAAMERWEGIRPEDVTDADRVRWQSGESQDYLE